MPYVERVVVPNERGAARIQLTFKKADGTADTPISVKWTLVDNNQKVVNNRRKVVAIAGETVIITLSGRDLLVRGSEQGRTKIRRWLVVEAVGSDGYNIKDTLEFSINNLHYIRQSTTTTTT